jgi:hypothetical protein
MGLRALSDPFLNAQAEYARVPFVCHGVRHPGQGNSERTEKARSAHGQIVRGAARPRVRSEMEGTTCYGFIGYKGRAKPDHLGGGKPVLHHIW